MSAERMDSLAPILVVDDEGPVRDLLTTILEECGYPCLAVADVAAAKKALGQIPVEMVLTDRDMPGETGIDLIRHVKAHHPDTGVIMVTVIDDIDQAREALDLGVYGYITKPFTRNQVLITVENGLRHRQTALENRHHAARLEDLVRQRTEALNEQLNLLRTLLDTIPAQVFYKDTDGVYLGCNQAFEEAVGRPRGAILGRTAADLHPPELAAQLTREDEALFATGILCPRESTFIHPDGSRRASLTHKAVFTGSDGRVAGLVGVRYDITELKTVAESLRRSEATLRSIMDHLHVGVVMCTETLAPVQVNRQMRRWFPELGEDGGGSLPGDLLARLAAAGARGTVPGPGEHTVVLPTALGERVFKVVLQPVQDGSHQAPAVIGLFEDVTDALTAERELRQAQKLEAIGQLAAGIAHEINTPIQYVGDNVRFLGDATIDLAAVLAGADRLCRAALAGEPAVEPARALAALQTEVDLPYLLAEIPGTIEQTLEGVERVATIVRAMREFSHPGTDDKTLVDINRALESTITVSRNEWKYVAEVETRLADDLPLLSCLPGELNQVFLNILVNAAHAIADQTDGGSSGKGVITVSTRADERWLEVRIADTGGGIPAHIQERIFDPFFTTKGVGRGTGQGLAIARSVVVDKHRGRLRFQTDPGRGTTFVIELPLHRPESPPAGENEVIPER